MISHTYGTNYFVELNRKRKSSLISKGCMDANCFVWVDSVRGYGKKKSSTGYDKQTNKREGRQWEQSLLILAEDIVQMGK